MGDKMIQETVMFFLLFDLKCLYSFWYSCFSLLCWTPCSQEKRGDKLFWCCYCFPFNLTWYIIYRKVFVYQWVSMVFFVGWLRMLFVSFKSNWCWYFWMPCFNWLKSRCSNWNYIHICQGFSHFYYCNWV